MKQSSFDGVRPTASSRISSAIGHVFFAPASPRPLGLLRVLVAASLLAQAYFLSTQIFELFGSGGIMQDSLTRFLAQPGVPRIDWLVSALARIGLSEPTVILGVGVAYVLSLAALFIGLQTRVAAVCSWFLHWMLMNSGYCTNYGADVFGHIFLFYFIWMPVGHAYSLDSLWKRVSDAPSDTARISLRVVQLHLCIVYLAGGLGKAVGPQWWDGDAIWRSLMLPVYAQYDMSWMAWTPWLATILGWGTLVVEVGYPIFIWPTRTRRLWVALTISLHLGIAIFLGLGVFGAVMAALTLAAFGVSAEPRGFETLNDGRQLLRRGIPAVQLAP